MTHIINIIHICLLAMGLGFGLWVSMQVINSIKTILQSIKFDMAATIKTSNINKPPPRWFRVSRKLIYGLTGGGILTGTLTRFSIPSDDQLLIVGWLLLFLEVAGSLLANGENYTPDPISVNATIVNPEALEETPEHVQTPKE